MRRLTKSRNTANENESRKAWSTKILLSSCALPRIGAAKASCIHVYYLFIQSTCSTLRGRGHPHCLPASFFHRFMLLRPWKEIMFCNLYKPIHLLVRLQPALSFFQRVGFSQRNPECKQGKASFQKPLNKKLVMRGGKENVMLLWLNSVQLVPFPRLFSPPRIDGLEGGMSWQHDPIERQCVTEQKWAS